MGKIVTAKILRIIAYIWSIIAVLIIMLAIIGNIIAIPKGLPLSNYIWQMFSKITEPFNPFNILNFLVTILILSPAIVLFWISEKLKK
jgi:hypothetical protein